MAKVGEMAVMNKRTKQTISMQNGGDDVLSFGAKMDSLECKNYKLPPLVDAGLQQAGSIQTLEVDLLGILLGCLLLARFLALLATGRVLIGLDKVKHDEHLVRRVRVLELKAQLVERIHKRVHVRESTDDF